MKALFIIAVGFLIGWAVTSRKVLQPNADPLVNPPNNGASPVYDLATSGVADGGT